MVGICSPRGQVKHDILDALYSPPSCALKYAKTMNFDFLNSFLRLKRAALKR